MPRPPQRLPKGPPILSESTERWDVGRIVIENETIEVRDDKVRNENPTSERAERVLTAAEVEGLFESNAHHTFSEWMDIIHGYAKKRGQ